jgi:hypothetical protein
MYLNRRRFAPGEASGAMTTSPKLLARAPASIEGTAAMTEDTELTSLPFTCKGAGPLAHPDVPNEDASPPCHRVRGGLVLSQRRPKRPSHPLAASIPRVTSNGEVERPRRSLAGASFGLRFPDASSALQLACHGPFQRLLERTHKDYCARAAQASQWSLRGRA